MKFQYFPHTADIRMKVEGCCFKELFVAGVLGMANILKEDICEPEDSFDIKSNIEIQATDQTCLLIDFLSEVLSHSYSEKSIFCKVIFLKLTATDIKADIYGKTTIGFDEEIKAVTYHEAEVVNSGGNTWETFIIFDI
ncbi:archease [Arenibacter sp. F26102]|uniref:archease n=1 Tax=Arenibacter sp. F26102 TaxID=2926416 RepID=UPI001FF301A1|nr:archease [Arenibacter sp. F26102]